MLHGSFGLRLAVARFVLPAACLLLPLAELGVEEAPRGASCTSVQRSGLVPLCLVNQDLHLSSQAPT